MSAFTDRLYLSWKLANGSQVGAQRRSRSEGYPRNQAQSPERHRRGTETGAGLPRRQGRGDAATNDTRVSAPCGQSPPALSLASK